MNLARFMDLRNVDPGRMNSWVRSYSPSVRTKAKRGCAWLEPHYWRADTGGFTELPGQPALPKS